MEARGELHCLVPPGKAKGRLAWTAPSDAKFEERFGVALPSESCEAWRASRRVQEYRLLEGVERVGMRKMEQAWKKAAGGSAAADMERV